MPVVAAPEDELLRLQALRETALLDTPPEEDFDCLARLASVICEAPIALITLLDEHRQWFKAKVGVELTECDRSISFCTHTIQGSDLFVVRDASRDPRFASNPLVAGDPGIRFYAGMPLETGDGFRLGSICVIDRAARDLSNSQAEALVLLARQANKLINLRRQQQSLEETIAVGNVIEKELRSSQQLFHAFMDNCPFPASMKDSAGRVVYYNQRYADLLAISREEWIAKTDAELMSWRLAATLRANDLSVLSQWKTLIFENETETPEGNLRNWRAYKFPFRDADGREYVAGFAVDVTADRESERKIREYQRALEEANRQLSELAVTDGLTGLLNRRAFDAALDREYATTRRYGPPLSLLILDVDNFKLFNDTFGHEEGDRVLRSVAQVIGRSFRSTDAVARYGGEEFAVLLRARRRRRRRSVSGLPSALAIPNRIALECR